MKTTAPLYQFTDPERDLLQQELLALDSPYDHADRFWPQIDDLIRRGGSEFFELAGRMSTHNWVDQPVIVVANCPVDPELPLLDPKNPVADKRLRKCTWISEAMLALWSRLTETEIICHRSVNDGDAFHDIHPKQDLFESQSQKTLGTLRLHRDFTNHYVSPDFVATLTLRTAGDNDVASTFVPTNDVIASLDPAARIMLRRRLYRTPFDDISTRGTSQRFRAAPARHAVIEGLSGIRYFEGRTEGVTEEAKNAIESLQAALDRHTFQLRPEKGDLVAFANNLVVHGRTVNEIRNLDNLRNRWLMKTHNVWSLSLFEEFFEADAYGVVDG